ncbi:MAG: DUF1538 domain-containing protein [Bacillota bacterium]|nr:DUF1538 domain-containing protein [Bacillota bacterium]MDW7728673.1 DUF1538 domain-containing protein [Bacillota bacterium]
MVEDVKEIILEVLQATGPIVIVIILIQFFVIRTPISLFWQFMAGAVLVTSGLFLFLVGVRVSLLPIGEMIGSELVTRGSLVFLLTAAFIFGFVITVAEPDVRVLALQVDFASGGSIGTSLLIIAVATGVGFFVAVAILRILLGIPISYLLASGYVLVVLLSFFTPPAFVAISFDAGGVTTGPMAVPFILAIGVGTTSVLGGKSGVSETFGLIGLASIGPVLGVMLLGVIYG